MKHVICGVKCALVTLLVVSTVAAAIYAACMVADFVKLHFGIPWDTVAFYTTLCVLGGGIGGFIGSILND